MIADYLEESKASQREWLKRPKTIDIACEPVPFPSGQYWRTWVIRKRTASLLPRDVRETIDAEVERVFRSLETKWRDETAHLSSITDMVLNQHYQSIIGLGPAVVPLLLRELAV